MREFYKNMSANDRLQGIANGSLLITETYQSQGEMRSDIVVILRELSHAKQESDDARSDLQKFRNARDTIQADVMDVFSKFHHSFGGK